MFLISDADSLLSQLGAQFSSTISSPWSFYSSKLRMRLVCIPASVHVKGMELIRLSVKAEIVVCGPNSNTLLETYLREADFL